MSSKTSKGDTMLCSFTLSAVLACDCEAGSAHQSDCANRLDTINDTQLQAATLNTVVAQVKEIRISMHFRNDKVRLLAIFTPPEFLDTSELLHTIETDTDSTRKNSRAKSPLPTTTRPPTQQRSVWRIPENEETMQILEKWITDVYQRLHPFLSQCHLRVGAVIVAPSRRHPADVMLLDVSDLSDEKLSDLIRAINGDGIASMPDLVLKVLPIAQVNGLQKANEPASSPRPPTAGSSCFPPSSSSSSLQQLNNANNSSNISMFEISSCPVCLHRIDPMRLLSGIPLLSTQKQQQHLCTDYCQEDCINQTFLQPWPSPPSSCTACESIRHYWKNATTSLVENDFFCCSCALQETLWVCLTCGFVGCGRYSQGHAEEHFRASNHPFSLELATLRIWDYASGEFAHRNDVLQCPFAPPKHHGHAQQQAVTEPGMTGGASGTTSVASAKASRDHSVWLDGDYDEIKGTMGKKGKGMNLIKGGHCGSKIGKPQPSSGTFAMLPPEIGHPKKANMIGEEYEALLQSALEDQAQHYEGELSRLRAALTAEQVDQNRVTATEKRQIDNLQRDIAQLRHQLDGLGHDLLETQAHEAGHRAASQRLLREQGVAKDLLDKIRAEAQKEHEQGKQQVEDLEQQIADLTGNLRMQEQFSQDKELSQAQIFGTTSRERVTSISKRGGKRGRRKR